MGFMNVTSQRTISVLDYICISQRRQSYKLNSRARQIDTQLLNDVDQIYKIPAKHGNLNI